MKTIKNNLETTLEFGRDYYSVINVADSYTVIYVEDLDFECEKLLIRAVRVWNKTHSYLSVSQLIKNTRNICEKDKKHICREFKRFSLIVKNQINKY